MTIADLQLFSAKLISQEQQNALPPDCTLRPLQRDDHTKGLLRLLSQLSNIGDVSPEAFEEQFNMMKRQESYYIIVVEQRERIVACATLVVEHKFLHGCSKAGHIEDVVVDDSQRGKRLGSRLIDQLVHIAKQVGCYKTILNCSHENVPFYEKCSFKNTAVQMACYFDTN
ncbi:acyl-CoA N-acyltransferase [Radiomyces spectabilis]|uniref:acyl-CoA N-acyltransferase n=1 Tax=Radiomyces spectabilis TaxID=64574 RepID=UPI00221EAF55|nr:acyl-CoA N-acyltransferase [Radiomyces spectabilis]KAI8374716.1 acyl-CoA N-acyltransferase [Radiomyces spectabilis]